MATAILVGLTFLATALDRTGAFNHPGEETGRLMGYIFLIALVVAIASDVAGMYRGHHN